MQGKRMKTKEIWGFLFFVGVFALNWPSLAVFRNHLPEYLFSMWFLLVGIIYLLVGRTDRDGEGG